MRVSLRDVGEVVRELVDYQRAAFGTLQVVRGEGVGGGNYFSGAVRPDIQGRQVTAGRMPGVTAHL
ncbi:MAG: hypothetical protein QOG75_774 [Mycobacterium sp.]|nr:hypothetical protein [Mycobacterium sp.]